MPLTNTNGINNAKTNSALEFVQWPALNSADNSPSPLNIEQKVLAIQTTRVAPHHNNHQSSSPYQGFNLGLHVGDNPSQVVNNRQYLQHLLPSATKIQWLDQVHGNKVVNIAQPSSQLLPADAVVTREKNICLAIMTADCLPILLVSKFGDEIAAIHGGWRPLSANIINNTLDKMTTSPANLYAWLGPCISKNVFEVGEEVRAAFTQQRDSFCRAFTALKEGKYLADLHEIAKIQLNMQGITCINSLPECTYLNTEKYYSYRKNAVTGRMATLICLH